VISPLRVVDIVEATIAKTGAHVHTLGVLVKCTTDELATVHHTTINLGVLKNQRA